MGQPEPLDNHVFLTGRPPVNEYISVVRSLANLESPPDTKLIIDKWRKAYNHILELEGMEADLADHPPVAHCPRELEPLIADIHADTPFQRTFAATPFRIAMVELDRLVVFQKHINLNWVEKIKGRLGNPPTIEGIFNVCLAVTQKHPPVRVIRSDKNVFVFSSPSVDMRFIEPVLIEPVHVSEPDLLGRPGKVLGLTVGFSTNYMSAIEIENRLVLNEGSHRAFALRAMGITHAPCVVRHVKWREELEMITGTDLSRNPDRSLDVIRPPLLKDYFDPLLHAVIPIPRCHRQVKITFNVETLDVPAL